MDAHTLLMQSAVSNLTTGYYYWPLGTFTIGEPVASKNLLPIGAAGSLLSFYVRLGSASGAGDPHTFTVYKNGAPTAMEVIFPWGDVEGICTTPLAVAAGDRIQVLATRAVGTNPGNAPVGFLFDFAPSTGENLALLGGTVIGPTAGITAFALAQHGYQTINLYTEDQVSCVAPCDLTLKNLWMCQPEGVATEKFRVTVRKNGADTLLTAQTVGISVSSDLVHQVTLVKGDTFNVTVENWGIGGTKVIQYGLVVVLPQKDYSSLAVSAYGSQQPNPAATSYNSLFSKAPSAAWGVAAIQGRVYSSLQTLVTLYIALKTAPGAGKSWVFTVMLDGVATAAAVTIAEADTVGEWTGRVDISLAGLLNMRSVPSGTPAATDLAISTIYAHTVWSDDLRQHYAFARAEL